MYNSFTANTQITFQLTRPRGARQWESVQKNLMNPNFNSHAREGRDTVADGTSNGDIISTHTPARGATFLTVNYVNTNREFQLTRPRGARHITYHLFV